MADKEASTETRLKAKKILEENSPAVIDELRKLLKETSGRGRPKGSGHSDEQGLGLAAQLLRSGVKRSEAIAQAAKQFPVHSDSADRRRLKSKLDEYLKANEKTPEELARVARKKEILRRAFEEDVGWDL